MGGTMMIKTINPYGAISSNSVYKVWEYRDRYYLLDKFGSIYQIDEKTYKEIKEHD